MVEKQMKFGPTTFSDDTELTKPITSFGPLIARGNLYAPQIKTNGPCTIGENLEIGESLKVNGPLVVKGSLTCYKEASAKVNGPVTINSGIIGGDIKVNGPLKSNYVEARNLKVNGPITVNEDLIAEENIVIGVGRSSKGRENQSVSVGGIIEAPVIRIKNYSSMFSPAKIIKKVIGLKDKFERVLILEDLRFKADRLELEGIELENCDTSLVGEVFHARSEEKE
jgi:hypothetical protein